MISKSKNHPRRATLILETLTTDLAFASKGQNGVLFVLQEGGGMGDRHRQTNEEKRFNHHPALYKLFSCKLQAKLEAENLKITYFNRHKKLLEEERVYGDAAVKWLYQNPVGRNLAPLLVKKFFSYAYGLYQSSFLSRKKITPFTKKFGIEMDDFLPAEGRNEHSPYHSFNEFFIRRFKPGKRPFVEKGLLPAFGEGRYLTTLTEIPVKGVRFDAPSLLNNSKWSPHFAEGPILIARLCPVDYHRFHFPDDGKLLDAYRVPGILHSVNPKALQQKPDIFLLNERQVSILESKSFGKLAMVEVGAICVGKIVQSFTGNTFRPRTRKRILYVWRLQHRFIGGKGGLDTLPRHRGKLPPRP